MDAAILLFLTSGLFLGWSLGTNDAANVFGTAVGTRMLRFTTAAVICSAFVILGAVTGGAGPVETLGRLGGINALPGSFMAALAAAAAIYGMSRLGLPVSSTQAIVGAIIGWSLFTATATDAATLGTIVATWVIGPLIAAAVAIVLFVVTTRILSIAKLHLVRVDAYTRLGLVLAGAFGAYSLGANNIANVMGVFVPAAPFGELDILGLVHLGPTQQLFLLGAIAISVGVFTHSKPVMMTVGNGLMPLTPVTAWVVIMAHSLVLSCSPRRRSKGGCARSGCRPSRWCRSRAPRRWSARCWASACSRAAGGCAGGSWPPSAPAGWWRR